MARSTTSAVSISRRGSAGGDPSRTVVSLRGEHDIATKIPLAVAIARAGQLDQVAVLLDMSAVTFLDASTIGAIVGSRNRLHSRGQSLEVRAPSPRARRMLDLCGLADLIRPEPRPASGPAPALATWVDVPPSTPRRLLGVEAAASAAVPPPQRVLVAADAPVDATDEPDRD